MTYVLYQSTVTLMKHPLGAPTVTLRPGALRRYMAHKGLSISDLARETRLSRQAVSLWLRAHRQPRPATRPKLLRLLGAEFSDLFRLEKENGR